MARTKKSPPQNVYQIKVALSYISPPIWRRLEVLDTITLADLHDVLQISMGWEEAHLHQFIHNRILYGEQNDENVDFGLDVEDEQAFTLRQLLRKKSDNMMYEYDFGDGWEHKITLEKILPVDDAITYPRCIKGKRACPPEDCGGFPGYDRLVQVMANPNDPEHDDMVAWLGERFDPEAFDIDQINEKLMLRILL